MISNTKLSKKKLSSRLLQYLPIYIMLIPVIVWFIVFKIAPIYGLQLAFKKFNAFDGIWGSKWIGLTNFSKLFSSHYFVRVITNTVKISLLKITTSIPSAVLLALLINELKLKSFKRIFQTISYLPHFISWVVIGGMFQILLSPNGGVVNRVLGWFGIGPIYFMGDSKYFVFTLVMTSLWQGVGWNSIIYIAALTGVSPELFEAASIDGANRFQRTLYVSLPALYPTIGMVLTLALGSVLSGSFDQVYNMYNSAVYSVADTIDTYVYRQGILNADYSFTTAVGLFKSVVSFFMVIGANAVSKRLFSYSIW